MFSVILKTTHLGNGLGHEVITKTEHSELSGIEDLVAELAITFYNLDVQVDITTCKEVFVM